MDMMPFGFSAAGLVAQFAGRFIVPIVGATVVMGVVMYGIHRLETGAADSRELELSKQARRISLRNERSARDRNLALQAELDRLPPPPVPTEELDQCPADCVLR